MSDTTMTLRISSQLKERLDAISIATKRSKSFLASEAVDRYVKSEEQYIEGIAEARADIKAGRTFSNDEVFKSIDNIIARAP